MNKTEAAHILENEIAFYKQWPYAYLANLVGHTETKEVVSETGKRYQLEIEFRWDDETQKTVVVLGSIDDGGWRSFFPLCRSFIRKPDGSYVKE
ncbi:MAG: hypothetical protein C4527_14870 [Candidatus Omnitrophota bacterium]|nr:MAG: hypothetical protein C4527_14870 [Candidatus Omnitrophota bacterium]